MSNIAWTHKQTTALTISNLTWHFTLVKFDNIVVNGWCTGSNYFTYNCEYYLRFQCFTVSHHRLERR